MYKFIYKIIYLKLLVYINCLENLINSKQVIILLKTDSEKKQTNIIKKLFKN